MAAAETGDGDVGSAVFENPLILAKICSFLERKDLLNIRAVSKAFNNECVRLFIKRGYGRWVNGRKYLEYVEKLLKKSRHPGLLIGKIKMKGDQGKNNYLDSSPEFLEMVTSNAEHVRSLRLDECYILEDVIHILNACNQLEELRWSICMQYLAIDDDDQELFEWMEFDFKNLSRFEWDIREDGLECLQQQLFLDVFIKKIITASDNLTMLSIQGWPLSQHLKPILEDAEVSKKIASLKTLHVNYDGSAHKQTMKENDKELLKLLSLVKNSIENLHLPNSTSEGLSTKWPEMPNLTTISLGNYAKVPDFSQIPGKAQAPKLKLLMLGERPSYSTWRQGEKNSWTRILGLNKKIKCFEDGQQQAITVVVMFSGYDSLWSKAVFKLLRDLKVAQLILNMDMKSFDLRLGGRFFSRVYSIHSKSCSSDCTN